MNSSDNPLRHQLEADLNQSEWLQKFKAISTVLQTLKTDVPLTQLCDVKWDTRTDNLMIHCPNAEIRQALAEQAHTLAQLKGCATSIIVKLAQHPDLIIGDSPHS